MREARSGGTGILLALLLLGAVLGLNSTAYARDSARETAPPEVRKFYDHPTANGKRVDWCLKWGAECGKPAADAFCHTMGHKRAAEYEMDRDIGARSPTRTLGDGRVCADANCDGFTGIWCEGTILRVKVRPGTSSGPAGGARIPNVQQLNAIRHAIALGTIAKHLAPPEPEEIGRVVEKGVILGQDELPFFSLNNSLFQGSDPNLYFFLPKEIRLAYSREGGFGIDASRADDDRWLITLKLVTNVDLGEFERAQARIRERFGSAAELRPMPFEEATFQGWESRSEWEIERSAASIPGWLDGTLPITLRMNGEAFQLFKELLENETGLGSAQIETTFGDGQNRIVPVAVSLLKPQGRGYSDLRDVRVSWDRKNLVFEGVAIESPLPLWVDSVAVQFEIPSRGFRKVESLALSDPAWMLPHEGKKILVAPFEPTGPLLDELGQKLKVEGGRSKLLDVKPLVTRYELRGRVADDCGKCMEAIWDRIEGASYVGRQDHLTLEIQSSAFDDTYAGGRQLDQVILYLKSRAFTPEGDERDASVTFTSEAMRHDSVAFFYPTSGGGVQFEYQVKAVFTDGSSLESASSTFDRSHLLVTKSQIRELTGE